MLVSPFNAIPSWEGYEYQGHIAIYVILKTIRDLLKSFSNMSTCNYTLEIEGAEDFSIKNGEDYLSLHQVKSGTLNLAEQDKFCFIISLLQYKAKEGHFHITPQNTLPRNFVEATCNRISALCTEFSSDVKSRKADLPPNSDSNDIKRFSENHIVIEDVSKNSEKGSKYNILKFFLRSKDLEINRDNVERAVKEIVDELKKYEEKLHDNKTKLTDTCFVNVYTELFDNSSDVKRTSYLLIEEILGIVYSDDHIRIDSVYSEFVYGQLLVSFKSTISESHEAGANSCLISFSDMIFVLSEDYQKKMISIAYQYFLVWKSIKESFESYPRKQNSPCTSPSCDSCLTQLACNLYTQKELVKNISEDEINNFLYRLMLKKPILGKSNNLPDDELIHRLLTCLIKEIDILQVENNNLIQAQKNGVFYRMTLNSSGESYELQTQLSKETENTAEDKLLLFETDVLITDQLNDNAFLVDGISTMVLGESEYNELGSITSDSIEKAKKNCNKPKIMRLIDRKIAKVELKND